MARLLIGERNLEHRAVLKDVFQRLAPTLTLDFVGNGEDILQYLSQQASDNEPALIILDPFLPSVFPGSLVQVIKAVDGYSKIPIVILAEQTGSDYYTLRASGFVALSFLKPSLTNGWEILVRRILDLTRDNKTEK